MNKEKIMKILIPLLAVVVVLESVILIPKLTDNKSSDGLAGTESDVGTGDVEESRQTVADFVFATDTKEMKVGKSYKVILNLVGQEKFAIDGLEAYIKYDPNLVAISGLKAGTKLPKETVLVNDSTSGVLKSVFLVSLENKAGFQVAANSTTEVVSFTMTPKSEGVVSFDLISGAEVKNTNSLLVETGTSDELPFASNKLDINVTK
ncbi:MAG: cohesin domain-containing protein [Candidatus Shapirobacteria bacterium]|nr:cohesin domain-containing protein [Candidatus Shapirobacteria bacterium]